MKRIDFLKTVGMAGICLGFTPLPFSGTGKMKQHLPPLLVDPEGNPITTLSKWRQEREVIRERWLNYLGALKPNPNTPALSVIKEDHPENLVRQLVTYEGEPGMMVRGYLIKPRNITKPLPGVVAMHSTSDTEMHYIAGVQEGGIVPFGYRLAKQGFVVFCPQCFLMTNKENPSYELAVQRFKMRHPESKGMAKMLFDAQRAVDVLVSLDEVDDNRIGAMGHSLGGKEAFYLGALDDRVKTIVSNEGGIGIDFSNWDDIWYLGKDIRAFKHQHHELLALVARKCFLLIGGDFADGEQSRPYIEAVLPVYGLYDKRQNIELLNHRQGHGVSPKAERSTYEWLKAGLIGYH